VLTVILSIEWLANGQTTANQLRRYAAVTAGVGIALFAIELLPERWVSPIVGLWCALIGALIYASGAGFIIGQLIAQLSADRLEWSGHHITLLQVFIFGGLIYTPSQVGHARGEIDRESASPLPRVQLEGSEPARDWRLVEVIGNSALLMSRGGSKDPPAFRVVAMADIKLIAAPSPK